MKRLQLEIMSLDEIDAKILEKLTKDGRASIARLAREIGLSGPSVSERVRRLEETGVIEGYTAKINKQALGLPFSVYIRVRPIPGQGEKVVSVLIDMEAVVECDRVTGDDCFVAKAYVRSVEDLDSLIDRLAPYAMTNTSVIQSSIVKNRLPPIPR